MLPGPPLLLAGRRRHAWVLATFLGLSTALDNGFTLPAMGWCGPIFLIYR
jgi:hypothetical protein